MSSSKKFCQNSWFLTKTSYFGNGFLKMEGGKIQIHLKPAQKSRNFVWGVSGFIFFYKYLSYFTFWQILEPKLGHNPKPPNICQKVVVLDMQKGNIGRWHAPLASTPFYFQKYFFSASIWCDLMGTPHQFKWVMWISLTSSISSPLLCSPAINFCRHRLNRCFFFRPLQCTRGHKLYQGLQKLCSPFSIVIREFICCFHT